MCECPYCEEEISADDLELYGDDDATETECGSCGKSVMVTASISVDYSAECLADAHDWEPWDSDPRYEFCSRCTRCRKLPE